MPSAAESARCITPNRAGNPTPAAFLISVLSPRVVALALGALMLAACGGGTTTPPPPPSNGGPGSGQGSGPTSSGPPRPFPGDYYLQMNLTSPNDKPLPYSVLPDAALSEAFVSITNDNRVAVVDANDTRIIATVSVPEPLDMDLSADGSLLYVGSGTPAFYVISTSTLQVTARIPLPPSLAGESVLAPIVMADGSVMLSLGPSPYLTPATPPARTLVRWDPATAGLDTNLNLPTYSGAPVATADRKQLLLSGSTIDLYTPATDTYTPTSAQSGGAPIAARPDGQQYATEVYAVPGSSPEAVTLFSANFSSAISVTLPPSMGQLTALFYSADGKYLYASAAQCRVAAVDTSTASIAGTFQPWIGGPFCTLDAADAGGALWGVADGGAFKIAPALNPSFPASWQIFDSALRSASPSAGPLAGGTTLTLASPTVPVGEQAYFGVTPGVNASTMPGAYAGFASLSVTTPPASAQGPVSILLTDPENNPTLLPDGFSYGPALLATVPALASPDGGSQITALGYDIDQGYFTMNGVTEPGAKSNYDYFNFPQTAMTVTPPASAPGWADVTINTPDGTATLKRGVQFVQQQTDIPNPSDSEYRSILYDSVHDLFYLLPVLPNENQIGVFDPAKAAATRLSLPASFAQLNLSYGAISPDGRYLLFAEGKSVAVVNTQNPPTSTVVPVSSATCEVAPTANNTVLLLPCAPGPLSQLDLATMTVSVRTGTGPGNAADISQASIASSTDGSKIWFAVGNVAYAPAELWRYDSATDSFTDLGPLTSEGQLEVSGNGAVLATGSTILNSSLQPALIVNDDGACGGGLNRTGSLFYTCGGIFDTHNGRELLSTDLTSDTVGGLMSPDGSELMQFIDSAGVIEYDHLAVVPLAAATVTPATGPAGTVIQVTGSGFVTGTTATLGGVAMPCTEDDAEDLTCAVPSLPTGGAPMVLSNPDGQTYKFELAFVVQ